MWLSPSQYRSGDLPLRHWCEQGDNLERYGWLEHDGTNFGVQELIDGEVKLTTSFVKDPHAVPYGRDWTARITVEQSVRAP
jgi:mannosyl-oligosaccharide glucosidase